MEALTNLAPATESDRSAVSNLTGTNSALTQELAQTNLQVLAARADIDALKVQLANMMNGDRGNNGDNNNSRNGNRNNNNRNGPVTRKYFNDNYCWSHGYHISKDHTRLTCHAQQTGHQTKATRSDTMGGSDRYKSLVMG